MKAEEVINTKTPTLGRVLLLFTFSILLSMLSAQNIDKEKTFGDLENDGYFSLFNYNGKLSILSGSTQKDSLYHPVYTWELINVKKIDVSNTNLNQYLLRYYSDTLNVSSVEVKPHDLFQWNEFKYFSSNKNIIVTGLWSDNVPGTGDDWDLHTTCFDQYGNPLWLTFHNLYPLSDVKIVTYSYISPNGEVYTTGQHQSNSGYLSDIFLSKIEANGNLIYSKRYFIPGYQVPWHTTELSDGALLICGASDGKAMFFKVNPITGDSIKMYNTLTMPGGVNVGVNYIEELSDYTYLSMVFDSVGQGYLCKLDTNFSLISYNQTNDNFDNFFRVNDNEYVGYSSSSPVDVYAFDTLGNTLWNLSLTTPENVSFTPDGQGGLMGAGNVINSDGTSNYYLVRIDSVGVPAGLPCHNPPEIISISANIVGINKSVNLGDSAIENLKYSDALGHNWYFQDGGQAYGQFLNYDFDETVYVDTFWCMLVVTDGAGCTDTMTINAYTGEILPNPQWPPIIADTTDTTDTTAINSKLTVVTLPKIYPNPFSNEISISGDNLPDDADIALTNTLGEQMQVRPTKKGSAYIINTAQLSSGLYYLKITSDNFQYSHKVMKE